VPNDANVGAAARRLAAEIRALQSEDDGLGAVVIGLPRRLDGSANDQTDRVRRLAALLASEISSPVALQDERLTSHEADELLAQRERDWRRRKQQVDAMAAALILQDFLDHQPRP
jgi:putative Holliday junction resolvase